MVYIPVGPMGVPITATMDAVNAVPEKTKNEEQINKRATPVRNQHLRFVISLFVLSNSQPGIVIGSPFFVNTMARNFTG